MNSSEREIRHGTVEFAQPGRGSARCWTCRQALTRHDAQRALRHRRAELLAFNYLVHESHAKTSTTGCRSTRSTDHRSFGALAANHNAPTLLNDLAMRAYEAMRASGLGRKDLTEAVNLAFEQSA